MTEERYAAAMEAREAARRDLEARRVAARKAKHEAWRAAQAERLRGPASTLTEAVTNRFAEDANPTTPPPAGEPEGGAS